MNTTSDLQVCAKKNGTGGGVCGDLDMYLMESGNEGLEYIGGNVMRRLERVN